MLKRKFEIMLPDEPEAVDKDVDWSMCFTCQSSDDNSPIVSPFKSASVSEKFSEFLEQYCC